MIDQEIASNEQHNNTGPEMNPLSLTTLLLLTTSVISVTAQVDSGFSWVNPKPLGDPLWDVVWVEAESWVAVGDNGFVHRSGDGGVSWQSLHHELLGQLWTVHHGDGLTIAAGNGGRVYRSTDGGRTWDHNRVPDLGQVIRDVHVVSRHHIVGVGGNLSNTGRVVVSRDGGDSWDVVDPGIAISFRSVDFIDSLHGWATGTYGYFLSTSDGGDSWTHHPSETLYGAALNTIRFRSRDTGVAAGESGRLFTTHDGGFTWHASPQRDKSVFRDAAWLDDSTVVVTGEHQQLRSTDAGLTWNEMLVGWRFLGISFDPSGRIGMSVGIGGDMAYSSDRGETWVSRFRGKGGPNIEDLASHPSGGMIAVGYGGGILFSRDFGDTWDYAHAPYENDRLQRVAYPSPEHAVTFTAEGSLYHSDDGGESWNRRIHEFPRRLYDMSFADEQTGWITGDRVILKTVNGGITWSVDSTSVQHRLWGVQALSTTHAYATGDGGVLFYTENGGETWKEIENDFTVRFYMVRADEEGNITLGWLGGLVHSTDHGMTWSDNPAPEGSNLQHFSFLTPRIGYCGQHSNPMLSTTDAGVTWRKHEHGIRFSANGSGALEVTEAIAPGHVFLAGGSGIVLEFRDPAVSDVQDGREAPEGLDLSVWGRE